LPTAAGTELVFLVGFREVQSGVINLTDLFAIMGYVAQLYEPLKTMGKKSAALQSQLASVDREFAPLDEIPEVEEKPHPYRLDRATGKLAFQNVSFAYRQSLPALDRVSFYVDSAMRM